MYPDQFQEMTKQHDFGAIEGVLVDVFKKFNFDLFRTGIEKRDERMGKSLTNLWDPTTLMMRFQPDCLAIKEGWGTLLVEVKSISNPYSNFAVQMDAFLAGHLWNETCKNVLYVFVDLYEQTEPVCCWSHEIPWPKEVMIIEIRGVRTFEGEKRRFIFYENWMKSANVSPTIYKHSGRTGGSNTSYFLIDKKAKFLVPITKMLQHPICTYNSRCQISGGQ